MSHADNPDAIRIGDREREMAIAMLHDAVGGGYLDLREFEERSRTVYAAKMRGDLRPALADLPAGAAFFAPAVPNTALGAALGPAETMDVSWTTVKKRGEWQLPARLIISGSMGTADLDLRQALVPLTGCVIDVQASWTTVKIRLGDAMAARTDGFTGGSLSGVKDKAGPPTAPGGPVLDIRGNADWTTVVLRRD
ncbi:DUF1707 SHOCT-like domain-containing protein [Nakamurella leprariae]|uniref:DUF1707 domain-containing protein n=1 Tax=Nakamurella leprariae TaxID=2803911 RepID=A0A938YEB5_9ACTN|nr:DUF1707 domain-containing protein [Nakamurella leprariae]MBM9467998.1 DUF1707 domain-containing protein [Nakamurella leprariae]